MQNKLFGLVSLSRKAGKLLYGFDAVKDAIASGEAQLVLYAPDLSPNTKASMDRIIEAGSKPPCCLTTDLTMYDYANICGKLTGVLAVTDAGFAAAISKVFPEAPVEFREE